MSRHLLFVCNALDDATRLERGIESDSPAASRKVFMLCQALRKARVRTFVLSLGRGRATGAWTFFGTTVKRVGGVPVVYAPYSGVRGVSELLSLLGLLGVLLRLARRPQRAVLFYNRMPAYLLTLWAAVVLRYRCLLDLEDGEIVADTAGGGPAPRGLPAQFDRHCRDGALLACDALARATTIRPVMSYYGTATAGGPAQRWQSAEVSCLMSGTICADTGAPRLIEALRTLRVAAPDWARRLRIVVTGKGEDLSGLEALAAEGGFPQVVVHGRTTDERYRSILAGCEVGLALKPVGGPLADSTFPSKVVEFAAEGLLVVTTDISDVRSVLQDGAVYLSGNGPEELVQALQLIVTQPLAARATASQGQAAVLARCAPALAGRQVADFIFGGRNG